MFGASGGLSAFKVIHKLATCYQGGQQQTFVQRLLGGCRQTERGPKMVHALPVHGDVRLCTEQCRPNPA